MTTKAENEANKSEGFGYIRTTETGQPSVLDLIRAITGKKHPHQRWARLLQLHPELSTFIERYKFPGSGQRQTPVLKKTVSVEDFTETLTFLLQRQAVRRTLQAGVDLIDEAAIQKAHVAFLRECGHSPQTQVVCALGRADIVIETSVFEVKHARAWKEAVGQVIVYARELGKYPELVLFGDYDYEMVRTQCTQMGIAMYGIPISSGNAERFIDGVDGPAYSNHEVLMEHMMRGFNARLN